MNDDDVTILSKWVEYGVLVNPELEVAWLNENIKEAGHQEQRAVAAFRMWRFMRDDAMMRKSELELQRIRACLNYCNKRLTELN